MDEPSIVPDKLKNPINFKILILIGLAGIGIQFSLLNLSEDDAGNLALSVSLSSTLLVAITSFFISKRYALTKVFGIAYLAYGIGFVCYFLGELLYYVFSLYLGIDPYPSIADIFYFLLYPFSITYLILNIRFFQPKISNKSFVLLAIVPIVFVSIYSFEALAELEELNFDFFYGMIFVLAATTTLSFAILGVTIFKKSILGISWLVLVIGIATNAIADTWYYFLEIFGLYFDAHPVTVIWHVSSFVTAYALYSHKKML